MSRAIKLSAKELCIMELGVNDLGVTMERQPIWYGGIGRQGIGSGKLDIVELGYRIRC